MGGSTLQSVQKSPDVRVDYRGFGFQLCLAWFLATSTWYLLGPTPPTAAEHHLRMGLVGVGALTVALVWFLSSDLSAWLKAIGIVIVLLFAMPMAVISSSEFEAASRVLLPAQIKGGRVVHEGLGLSYAMLPNHQIDLRPTVSRKQSTSGDGSSKLQFGEMAIVSRFVQSAATQSPGHGPSWMILEIQRDHIANLNAFVRDVRREEAKWAALPNIEIVRHTHRNQIAGLETVEFEFVKQPERLWARQVFLRAGVCVLNFMLNSELESDRPMFDDFLKSIHLESQNR